MTDSWHGSHGPSRSWREGRWAFELRDDELADLTFDGRLVLRSIRGVVRDSNWNTAEWVIERVQETAATLELLMHTRDFRAELRGTLRVDATEDRLVVSLDAISTVDFDTNRTGLVVLHSPRLAGADLAVTHSDGSVEQTAFPVDISPHQPAADIAGLSWTHDGLDVEVGFTGDVFEMEDQRNWTDASYKTYSRPLALPFPYRVAAGERVLQTVAVRIAGDAGAPTERRGLNRIVLTDAQSLFPALALGASTAPDPAPAQHTPVAETLVVELELSAANRHAALARAAASGRPLDVRLALDPDAPGALDELVTHLAGLPVVRIAAFDPVTQVTDEHAASALRGALAAAHLELPVVGGSRAHFTELNRERRRIADDLDGIVFGITPLFHSRSTEQLVESVAIQRIVAEQAVRLADGRAVHVGPVTLRPRFNDVATTKAPLSEDSDLGRGYGAEFTDADDPRQDVPQLAAWTIASAAALAVPGVASIAYFEEWGPRGALHASGADRPVAAALRALERLADARLLWGASPDGLVWALGGEHPTGRTVLLANLGSSGRDITLTLEERELGVHVPAEGWLALSP